MEYSLDLRERVIAYIEQGGKKVDACVLFQVSHPTINKWIRLKKETGSLKKPPLPPRPWRKIDPEILIAQINEEPDRTLSDYAVSFGASNSGISRALKRINFTRKKRPLYTESGMN